MGKNPKKKKRQVKKRQPSKRLQWGVAIAVIAVSFGALFFFALRFAPSSGRSVAEILPADRTLAYIEMMDKGNSAPEKLWAEDSRPEWLEPFKVLLESTAEGHTALGLIEHKGVSLPVLLVERKEGPVAPPLPGQVMKSIVVGGYEAFSQEPDLLAILQGVSEDSERSLARDPMVKKATSHLPRSVSLRGYFSPSFLAFSELPPDARALQPILRHLISHLSFTMREDQRGLIFNTYLALSPQVFRGTASAEPAAPFAYRLTELLSSEGLIAYNGGASLEREWQHTLQTLQRLNPSYAIIAEGLLRTQVKQMFGDAVDLRNDLYPLLSDEYALALYGSPDGPGVRLILRHSDPEFASVKIKKMTDAFRSVGGRFVPRLQIFALPDGSESRVLVADPERMKERSEEYEGYAIDCVEITESPYGICAAVTDTYAVLSNTLAGVRDTIDLTVRPRFTLSQFQPFRKGLARLARVSDELTFVNLENLTLKKETAFAKLLLPFESLTMVKHAFRDGVSSEGYLLLK